MHKELFVKKVLIFYSITLQCWSWKHMIIMKRIKWKNSRKWKD